MRPRTNPSGSWHVAHRRWFGYSVAAVALAATILARSTLGTVLDDHSLPLLFIVPVALAAYAGGLGPTIAVTLGGAVAELWFLVPQVGWQRLAVADGIGIALFIGAGVLLSVTSEGLHRARGRAESVRRRLQQEAEARARTEARVAELNNELHRSLREVSRSEHQLNFVMDAMPQKVFSASPTGIAQYANTQWSEYTGLSAEEITAGAWVQSIHPDDRREGARRWAHAMRSGETFVFEHRIRRYDGVYRWHISRAVPQHDTLGKIVLWVGSSTDVHELKVAQEALREADVLKDEFLATLAHELRNPLAPLVTSAEILAHSADPAASDQARATIRRQIAHMVRLVDDLLDVSRITRNVMQIRKEATTLGAVMAAAVETVRDSADCTEQKLTVALPDEPIHLEADPVRLTQVFANLLNNACKYTPRGGSISVAAQMHDGWVVVRVRDTGIGIPRDKLSDIFGAFARVHHAVDDEEPRGLGIGLALVRRVVDLHGGSVIAESEGEGRGSEFVVRLPTRTRARKERVVERVVSRETPYRHVEPALARQTAKRPHRVLVVDDNVDAAESLDTLLSLGGMETRVAHDGMEALYTAADFRPDAAIIDIGLPKLDGHELAKRLRAAPWAKGMRLVALSGWAQESDRQKSREAGFDVHLAKPVTFGVLMDALNGAPDAQGSASRTWDDANESDGERTSP
ncbi:MAG: hybrid sensor histidine kinase/response regulator [Gemmatimonadaceae bacterium]